MLSYEKCAGNYGAGCQKIMAWEGMCKMGQSEIHTLHTTGTHPVHPTHTHTTKTYINE